LQKLEGGLLYVHHVAGRKDTRSLKAVNAKRASKKIGRLNSDRTCTFGDTFSGHPSRIILSLEKANNNGDNEITLHIIVQVTIFHDSVQRIPEQALVKAANDNCLWWNVPFLSANDRGRRQQHNVSRLESIGRSHLLWMLLLT